MSVGISLGWNCTPAAEGVHRGLRATKADGYRTCPFDKMITNLPGLISCLTSDFEDFTNPAYLGLLQLPPTAPYMNTHGDGDLVIFHAKYRFIFNHESPGHANLHETEEWPGGPTHFVKNGFKEFIRRYERRISNFRDYLASGEHIDFLSNHAGNSLLHAAIYPALKENFTLHVLDAEPADLVTAHNWFMGVA